MTEADWQKADTLEPEYGSMGEIVNLGKMSQRRAKAVVEADIKAKGDKSFYEKLDSSIINKGSFNTDIPYAARGTSKKFQHMLSELEKQGFDTSNVKITSAIGTLGSRAGMSPHSYSTSATGHFSPYATTIDISDIHHRTTGKRLTQADLRGAGLDYYLYNKGKDHEDHEHISFGMLDWQREAIKASKQQQKAVAEQHSMNVMEAYNAIYGKDKLQESVKKGNAEGKTLEEIGKAQEEELKKQGIYQASDKSWVQNTGNGGSRVLIDPQGNKKFEDTTFNNATFMSNWQQMGGN